VAAEKGLRRLSTWLRYMYHPSLFLPRWAALLLAAVVVPGNNKPTNTTVTPRPRRCCGHHLNFRCMLTRPLLTTRLHLTLLLTMPLILRHRITPLSIFPHR